MSPKQRIADLEKQLAEAHVSITEWAFQLKGAQDQLAEKDKEIERLQDMLYELLGELTALRAEKQMRGYIKQLKDSAATSEREKVAEENAELLQALQNLHQRCHWADAPEEMDAAKAAIEKAIRARGEQLREALKTYGQHRNNCAAVLGGYQCTCGFNQQEQTR